MIKRVILIEALAFLLVIIGVAFFFSETAFIFEAGKIIAILGLIGIVFNPIYHHILTAKSARLVGFYIIGFLILNICRHYKIYYFVFYLKENLSPESYLYRYTIVRLIKYTGCTTKVLLTKKIFRIITVANFP